MKTEMKIKSGSRSEEKGRGSTQSKPRAKEYESRLTVCKRSAACAALLCLLAVGGYVGAMPRQVKMTAAPVLVHADQAQEIGGMTFEEVLEQQKNDRQEEIALLDSVILSESADDETKRSALEQKTQLAQRMETESTVRTALAHMGYHQAAALCGAGQLMLIMPENAVSGDDDMLRIIDAASAAAQIQAQNVKIILVKK